MDPAAWLANEILYLSEVPEVTAKSLTLAILIPVEKSGKDFSPILKDARGQGYEGLSKVAQDILAGKYYKPTEEEVGF